MHSRKILIAEPSEEFRQALVNALSPYFQIFCCHHGDRIPALLAQEQPELMILELNLPGLDGISLLEGLPQRPPVLVVSDFANPYVYGALIRLDVEYAIRKPAPLNAVVTRAMDLLQTVGPAGYTDRLLDTLIRLGIPSGKHGFQHLLTGLPLLILDRNQQLSKELYEAIGRIDQCSAFAVEKAIREAIREGWASGEKTEWKRLFPYAEHCPRNKEFLFRISDLLREQRRCG